jgi:hypothetical protein
MEHEWPRIDRVEEQTGGAEAVSGGDGCLQIEEYKSLTKDIRDRIKDLVENSWILRMPCQALLYYAL